MTEEECREKLRTLGREHASDIVRCSAGERSLERPFPCSASGPPSRRSSARLARPTNDRVWRDSSP
jgi:hypothetical protein